jgi:hypothetical protein
MNDNVVQFPSAKAGDLTFMLCGCNPKEPQPFIPIVVIQRNPIIAGLQCPSCEQHLTVVNGIVQEPTSGG